MSREQGGRLVEMPYKLDAARFILATNEVPSHTPLSAFGFRALSRLFMNGLVHSCIVLLNKNSISHITFAGLLHSMVSYSDKKKSHPSKRTRHPKGSGPTDNRFSAFPKRPVRRPITNAGFEGVAELPKVMVESDLTKTSPPLYERPRNWTGNGSRMLYASLL